MQNIIQIDQLEKLFSREVIDRYNRVSSAEAPKDKPERMSELIHEFHEILKQDEEFIPAYNNLAELYIRQGDINQAMTNLKKGLELIQKNNPKSQAFGPEMQLMLRLNASIAVYRSGPEQQGLLLKLLYEWPREDNPLSPEHAALGSYLAGYAWYQSNTPQKALAYLEFARPYYDRDAFVNRALADLYYQNGDYPKAVAVYESLTEEDLSFQERQRYGMALLRAGEFDKSELHLTRLLDDYLAQSPRREEHEKFLQAINEKKRNFDTEQLQKRIQELEKEQSNEDTRELGVLYVLKGEYQKALSFFNKAAQRFKEKIQPSSHKN